MNLTRIMNNAAQLIGAVGVIAVGIATPASAPAQIEDSGGQDVGFVRDISPSYTGLFASGDLPELVRRFDQDRNYLDRFYSLDSSPRRIERMRRFYDDWEKDLSRVDFDKLSHSSKIEYILLSNEIRGSRNQLDQSADRIADLRDLIPFNDELCALEEDRWKLEAVDARATASRLTSMTEVARDLKDRVERRSDDESKTEEPKNEGAKDEEPIYATAVQGKRAARVLADLERSTRNWYENQASFDPEFGWWMKGPYEDLSEALESYRKHLDEEIAEQKGEDDDPLVGDPIGRDALTSALEYEMIAYSPEELIEIAEREFAWCEEQGRRAAAEMEVDNWKAALESVKNLHVSPGRQDDLVSEQALFAIDWVAERDLVTIEPLCRETWRVQMLSADAQRTLPFAAYSGQQVYVAYPTEDMDHEAKEMSFRGNNEHFTRIVTPHELIPGHHLQGYMAQRYAQHRRVFRTPFHVEGWALYWEMLMWDQGYPRGPEDAVGMLFWRMHRAARIIVTLRYHLGDMETAEMVDFLVDRVGHERSLATSEVRRYVAGNYGPLYQCAYMLGGLQLRELAHQLTGSPLQPVNWTASGTVTDGEDQSGRSGSNESAMMTLKEFHDAVLHANAVPIAMVRAELLGEPMTVDWQTQWRFAESR